MTSRESVRSLKYKDASFQVHDVTCIISTPVKSDINHHRHHHHQQQQHHHQQQQHHHHHLHSHQYHHHHHHLGSHRSHLNGCAYKMQNNPPPATNNRHPQKVTVCINNNSNINNSINNKNFLKQQKQDQLKAATSNDDQHHHHGSSDCSVGTCDEKSSDINNNNNNNNNNNSNNDRVNCNNSDVRQRVETENTWQTSTGIVSRTFASVVASKTASTSDALVAVEDKMVDCTDEEVDDGFEDSNSLSHHHQHHNSNNCCDSNCNNCTRSTEAAGFHSATSDGNADVVEEDGKMENGKQSSKKNQPTAIRDIPERFKKLLKAAADKATAQRIRVEGAPLIRSFHRPAAAPMRYIFPQSTPPVMVPSYPTLVPQPIYVHSPDYEVQSSGDQGGLAQNKSSNSDPQGSVQVDPYVQPDTEYYNNALPAYHGQYMANSNHGVPVVSATPYGHMTYYIAPVQPQYQVVYGPEAQYYCCNPGATYLDQQLCPLQQQQYISDQQQQSNLQDSMLAC